MQSFSLMALPFIAQAPAAPAPSPTAEQLLDEIFSGKGLGTGLGLIAILIVAGLLVQFISYWIASKVVATDESSFANSVKLWFLYLLAFIGIAILTGVLFVLGTSQDSNWLKLLGLGMGALLTLIVLFKAPMQVYKIGFLRALGFLVIAVLINAAANTALSRFLMPAAFSGKDSPFAQISTLPESELQAFVKGAGERIRHGGRKPTPAEIAADKTRPLQDRQRALQEMQSELEAQRAQVKPGDRAATDAYNAALSHYIELLKEVQAESSKAQPTPQPAPSQPAP